MSKLLRSVSRIALALGIVFAIAVVVIEWVLPVGSSLETAHKPPQDSWLVPHELSDQSIVQAPGTKLSYFGYEFEVPWTDFDEAKTKSYPNITLLTFHSGLRLMIGASPPKMWMNGFFDKTKDHEVRIERTFGVHSDYDFLAKLYAFTPDKIHLWSLSPRLHYREMFMLLIKSGSLSREAETGFFNVGNSTFKGFQKGDPQAWLSNYPAKSRSTVFIDLFSDQGNLTLFQKDFQKPAGVSQADINRIIQTVHRVPAEVARTKTPSA